MAPSFVSSKSQASTSSTPFAKLYNGSFLPSSMGNAVACYSSATFDGGESKDTSNSSSKGKGKASKAGKGKAADDGDVKFVEFDALKRSRRTVRGCSLYGKDGQKADLQLLSVHNRDIHGLCKPADHRSQVSGAEYGRCGSSCLSIAK